VWLPDGENKFDLFSRFDTIPAFDEQTEGQTNRRTSFHRLLPRYACASRGNNRVLELKK